MRFIHTYLFIAIMLIGLPSQAVMVADSTNPPQTESGNSRWDQHAQPALNPGLSWARPVGMFAEVDTSQINYFGIGGDISGPILRGSPFRLGVGFRYFWMGDRDDISHFHDDNGDLVELKSKVKGSMMPVHVNLRFDLGNYTNFPIIPYAGAFAGFRIFNVNNQLTYDYKDGSEPYSDNNHNLSLTSSYGYELGVHIRITENIMLDGRWERAFGGWAKYLDVSSVQFDANGSATYDRHSSRTDVEVLTFGLSMTF